MSCELKNIKDPCQIQCSFPEVANGKGDFAVYLNSFDGPAVLVVSCTHNGKYACVPDEVVVTYENLNKATITVTETFANKNGTFSCQRGDIPMTNKCQVPFTEKAHSISNFKVDRAIAHGASTLKPQQFEEGNASSAAIIGVIVGVAVLLILVLVIGLLLYRRHKNKKRCERSEHSKKGKEAQFMTFANERKKPQKQLETLIRCSPPKKTNPDISCEEQGSIFNKLQENGGAEVKCADSNINDSGLEEKSGSSPPDSDGSDTPLI